MWLTENAHGEILCVDCAMRRGCGRCAECQAKADRERAEREYADWVAYRERRMLDKIEKAVVDRIAVNTTGRTVAEMQAIGPGERRRRQRHR